MTEYLLLDDEYLCLDDALDDELDVVCVLNVYLPCCVFFYSLSTVDLNERLCEQIILQQYSQCWLLADLPLIIQSEKFMATNADTLNTAHTAHSTNIQFILS